MDEYYDARYEPNNNPNALRLPPLRLPTLAEFIAAEQEEEAHRNTINTERQRAQQAQDEENALTGVLRFFGQTGLGAANYTGQSIINNAELGAANAGLFSLDNGHDPHGWIANSIGKEKYQELKDKHAVLPLAEGLASLGRGWKHFTNNADNLISGTTQAPTTQTPINSTTQDTYRNRSLATADKSLSDRIGYGAGTALGFGIGSAAMDWGISSAIGALSVPAFAVHPLLGVAVLGTGALAKGSLEAGTEAGGFIIDEYDKDPNLFRDVDKLRKVVHTANQQFVANAIPDAGLDAVTDFIFDKIPAKGLTKKFIKSAAKEIVKENAQEAYQTATQNATEQTFLSGDLSWSNFGKNLLGEYRKILPYTDEKGNKHSGYLANQALEVTASTILSTGLMTALGLPNPKKRGHIFTKAGREQMRRISDAEDWANRSQAEIDKDNETAYNNLKTIRDNLQNTINLRTERDNLQESINRAYENLSNNSTTDDGTSFEITRATDFANLGQMEQRLKEINKKIAGIKDFDDTSDITDLQEQLQDANTAMANFWRGSEYDINNAGVVSTKDQVQAEAGIDLFPDADEISQTSSPNQNIDNPPAQDTQQPQNIPPIYEDDDFDIAAQTAPNSNNSQGNPTVNILGQDQSNISTPDTGSIQNNEPDLLADVQNDNDVSPMDMLSGNRNSQSDTTNAQQNNLPEDFVDEIDDEPDNDFDDDYSEQYNQLITNDNNQSHDNNDTTNNGEQNAGTFVFSAGIGANARDYSFNVVSTFGKVREGLNSSLYRLFNQRLSRWNGQFLEIRTKRGKTVAKYNPHFDTFSFSTDFDRKHSTRWKQKFERDFRAELNSYLNGGGFLDERGRLKPDGNEEFRKRWRNRQQNNPNDFYNAFNSNELQPEDLDTPSLDTLSVSFQNSEGIEVNEDLSVTPGSFSDNMPEQKRYYGSYLDIKNGYGNVIARYAPRTGRVSFVKGTDAGLKQAVAQQLRRKAISLMDKAGFLDENGNLIPDGYEGYRARRKAANDIPSSMLNQQQNINPETQAKAQGANTLIQQEIKTPNQQIQPKSKNAQPAGAISNVGNRIDAALGNNSDTYNQQAQDEETQQSWATRTKNSILGFLGLNNDSISTVSATQDNTTEQPAATFKVKGADGQEHTLTVRRKSFSNKHKEAQQYHGSYLEATDENGRVVARWSPYSMQFQMANIQDADVLQPQILQSLNANRTSLLQDFGYLDEYGRLKPDGNEKFRQKYRARQYTTPEGMAEHSDNLNTTQTKKRKDTRSWKQRIKDTWDERKKYEPTRRKVRNQIYKELRKFINDGETSSEYEKLIQENLIKEIEGETPRARNRRIRRYVANLADAYSHVITARINAAAHLAGMSVEDYHKLWNLRIQQSEIEDTRGQTVFQPAGYKKDEKTEKNVWHNAETIIHLTQMHNESTILHEFAHIFLRDYQDLIASVDNLPSKVKKDWLYLTRWLGISDIDPKSTKATRTEEQQRRYQNAQEKFAVAFEQYYMTGKAPMSRLQRVFNYFKEWLSSVYGAIQNITYAGSDGRMHEVELSPEIKRIFGRMLKGSSFYTPSAESARARIERTNNPQHGEEFNRQTVSGQDNDFHIGRQNSIRDVVNAMNTEQGRKNAGKIWVDYANVSKAEAERLSTITGLDISDRYVHSLTGEAVAHVKGRHGEGNEQRQDQLPITDADFERIPDVISNPDEIIRGMEKANWGSNDTIVYKKRINGHVLVVEEVRTRKRKLAFHTMMKSKAGYDYDLLREGNPIVKDKTKSQAVTSYNDPIPEVQSAHALSNQSLSHDQHSVNSKISHSDTQGNSEIYHQTAGLARTEDDFLKKQYDAESAAEAKRQYDAVVRTYRATPQWMKAPNGKKSNLTEKQWVIVRTPNFKRWFGDWENDPANASKVLDKNGEPLVVYHGTPNGSFNTFKVIGEGGAERTGAWFMNNRNVAQTYTRNAQAGRVYAIFLNIRNPYILDAKNRGWNALAIRGRKIITTDHVVRGVWAGIIGNKNHDGVIIRNVLDPYGPVDDYILRIPSNIKSATHNNGNFSRGFDEIYKQIIGTDGARRLDEAKGTHIHMDNLRLAKRMERNGIPTAKIWAATGWTRGADNKWRYEIPDGKINRRKLDQLREIANEFQFFNDFYDNNPNHIDTQEDIDRYNALESSYYAKLSDVFDAPELFAAYPDLRDIEVWIDNNIDYAAAYDTLTNSIVIGGRDINFSKKRELRRNIIHEVQHAIQEREGFTAGSSYDKHSDTLYKRYINTARSLWDKFDTKLRWRIRQILNAKDNGDIHRMQSWIEALSDKDFALYNAWAEATEKAQDRNDYLFSKYYRHSGEVEARNAEGRAYWSDNRRRSTPLDRSEDISRDKQIIGRLPKKSNRNSFISAKDIERFNQIVTHATGHIIADGRFDLKYVGTGEGGQYFGHGIYFEQSPVVADTYRRMGITDEKDVMGYTTISLKNGQSFSAYWNDNYSSDIDDTYFQDEWTGDPDGYMKEVLSDVQEIIINSGYTADIEKIKRSLLSNYTRNLQAAKEQNDTFKVELFENLIKFLNKISSYKHEGFKRGNVYFVDIPENYELLNWDDTMAEQPKQVKANISRMVHELRRRGYTNEQILGVPSTIYFGVRDTANMKANNISGGALYQNIFNIFMSEDKSNDERHIKKRRAQEKTSAFFNDFGISGHRYFDRGSRSGKQGTHNFVIWNTDRAKIVGISHDSDIDARYAFYDTVRKNSAKQDSSEIYKQIIGEAGARRLDEADNATTRMDNLAIAKQMERNGMPVKKIWLATGWMRGAEGKWRYEIPDGKVIGRRKFNKRTFDKFQALLEKARIPISEEEQAIQDEIAEYQAVLLHTAKGTDISMDELGSRFDAWLKEKGYEEFVKEDPTENYDFSRLTDKERKRYEKLKKFYEDTTLQDVFDAPELFKAYPQLRRAPYFEADFSDKNSSGEYFNGLIRVDTNLSNSKLRSTLIHEIQHAIQKIEGFALGNDDEGGEIGRIEDTRNMFYEKAVDVLDSLTDKKSYDKVSFALEELDSGNPKRIAKAKELATTFSEEEKSVYEEAKGYIEKALALNDEWINTTYAVTAGEIESRNTQTRRNWGDKRRRNTPLNESEDVPREKQLIRLDSNIAETYNQPLNNDVDLDRQINIVRGKPIMPRVQAWQRKKSFSKQIHSDIISRFLNGNVVNNHTGLTVTLTEHGLDHIINSARNSGDDPAGRTLYQAIPYLDKLVREAYRVESHEDRKPSATKIEGQLGNLKQIHRFLVPVDFGDGLHIVKLTAKEYETGKAEIDEVSLYDMKHAKKMSHLPIPNSPDLTGQATGTAGNSDNLSVRDMLEGVNDVYGNPYSETYNQIIGYGAALRLDEKNGNHNLIDNLRIAQRMERKLKPNWTETIFSPSSSTWKRDYSSARKIWNATGWFRGADGQWKYEIPYGQIITDAFNKLPNNIIQDKKGNSVVPNITLSSIFNAPQLFNAYPNMKDMFVHFIPMDRDTDGFLDENDNIDDVDDIFINIKHVNNPDKVREILTHEIQHWIQSVEGFAYGGGFNMGSLFRSTGAVDKTGRMFNPAFFESKNYSREAQIILDSVSKKQQDIFHNLYDLEQKRGSKDFNENEYNKLYAELKPSNKDKYRAWFYLTSTANHTFNFPIPQRFAYSYFGGEVEARNAAKRSSMSETERMQSFPINTQDIASENQFIFDHKDKPFSMETYNQTATERNNKQKVEADNLEWVLRISQKQLDTVRRLYQGTDKWMKAPNGQPTNLTEKQWLQVRTPNFKRWFGDWEKHPEHASKIVDKNGEPLVVWHGNSENNSFSVFDKRKIRKRYDNVKGFFFSPNARRDSVAGYYAEGLERPFFLNIRNPIAVTPDAMRNLSDNDIKSHDGIVSTAGYDLPQHEYYNYRTNSLEQEQLRKGDIIEIVAFERGQIKSATGNNGMFSTETGDIYKQAVNQLSAQNDSYGAETYFQIGAKRKHNMDIALTKRRPDMTPEQRADAISEIEKLGELSRDGKYPKLETAAHYWLLNGHIRLPEDSYKILDAVQICEEHRLNPMSYKDPNEILVKYTHKVSKSKIPTNPDTVPEFRHKVEHENGITVYTVSNTKKGQLAVRRIIDTHWGEDANPWCLAARNEYGELDRAWSFWKQYNSIPKQIAFRNGKLLAFCASHTNRIIWWDREDNSHEGIPYTIKENGNTIAYSYNELTRQSTKVKETLADGTERNYDIVGRLRDEYLPDGTIRHWYNNGQIQFERLPDGTIREWHTNGQLKSETHIDRNVLSQAEIDHLLNGGEVYNQTVQNDQQDRQLINDARNLADRFGLFGDNTAERYFQHLGIKPIQKYSPELLALLERNRRAEPAFRSLMDKLHKELGGDLILRKEMKSPERIIIKANRVFGGNISKVGDVWAATLAFDTENELFDALTKLRQRNDVIRIRNRWTKPKISTGYRDIISYLKLNDGTVVELQLQMKDVQDVKDNTGHYLYEFISNNQDNYELDDLVWKTGDLSKRLYSAAIDGSYKTLSKNDKNILRSLAQSLANSHDFNEAQEAIDDISNFLDKVLPEHKNSDRETQIAVQHNTDSVSSEYIQETERSIVVPMSELHVTERINYRSKQKALDNMAMILRGNTPKREPLTVRLRQDGGYDIINGNNTYSALKDLGANLVPVEVLGSPYNSDNSSNASAREQGTQSSVNNFAVSSSTSINEPSGENKYTRPDGIKSSGILSSPARYSTANGAPSTVTKYFNISNSSNPDDNSEIYYQISARRKNEMDAALTRRRPDMTPQQRADAISEIEKLGESIRQGGNPKVEKLAHYWLLNGHIRLPEDNYKILDAIRISEQRHIDPMRYDDPNEILAKYTIKPQRADLRINPDTIPEFSNKVNYGNGITVYTVDDTEAGQLAVRRIIDTHWGEDANPWCLAARTEIQDFNEDEYDDEYEYIIREQNINELSNAWDYWSNTYNTVDKRIAFKDGKLLAFCASEDENNTWWDREDKPHDGIPYTVKENGNTFEYSYNETTEQSIKIKETLSDGTIRTWYESGKVNIPPLKKWGLPASTKTALFPHMGHSVLHPLYRRYFPYDLR